VHVVVCDGNRTDWGGVELLSLLQDDSQERVEADCKVKVDLARVWCMVHGVWCMSAFVVCVARDWSLLLDLKQSRFEQGFGPKLW
jgi:hypothetical protein